MEEQLKRAEHNEIITSRDHRVVWAITMLVKVRGQTLDFAHRGCVHKSWPQFWDFLEATT
ncbi:hypothetical protein IT415_03845 [bacterium]|nr:hypothetical protein [bacterium]